MSRSASHYQTVTRRDLSPRQREVLALIAAGRTNGEIAERLGITLDGAKWHVSEILGKLGVSSREAAAEWWAASGGFGSRLATAMRGLVGGLFSWKVAAPVAGVAVFAVGLGLLAGRDEDSARDLPDCTVDDVILEPVESATRPDGQVLVVVTGRSRGRTCLLEGRIAGTLNADTVRRFDQFKDTSVRVELGLQRTAVAHIVWSGGCAADVATTFALAAFGADGLPSPIDAGPLYLVGRPACNDQQIGASNVYDVLPAMASSFRSDIGPDPLDFVYCYPSEQAELDRWFRACQATELSHAPGVVPGTVTQLLEAVETREFVCPAPEASGKGSPSILCEGAAPGDRLQGIPVSFLNSAGDALSVAQLESRLSAMIETAKRGQLFYTRVATVACLNETCDRFVLGVANDGSPAAAYFVFEPRGERSAVVAVGFAGENALIIRRGGQMRIGIDEEENPVVHFVPIVPPY